MVKVTVEGETREYEKGVTLQEIAEDFQNNFDSDIVLANVDGKLRELHKKINDSCNIKFLTCKDKPGMQTYQRSAILVMLKAFYEIAGAENIDKITVEFTIGNGFFIRPEGKFELTDELLKKVKCQMQEYISAKIPIMKRSVNTDDAVEMFHKYGMYDKEKLFHYRRVSRVNLYNINGFEDYYYGYMLQNTGYIKYFDLLLYKDGFVLMLPDKSNPNMMPEFKPLEKLYNVLRESTDWGRRLNIANVGSLNERICMGGSNELILIQEALQEQKIGNIAQQISSQPDKKFVMIAGPSSSGKTTFSHRLSIELRAQGLIPHPIAVDDYFKNRENTPKDANGNYDFEVLDALDVEQFNKDMTMLLQGNKVELPRFNFKTGKREYKGDYLHLGKEDILVIEGIHCLNDKMSYMLPIESKFKIYISALTPLNIDEHNRIPTTDVRLIRRMVRDARTRGTSAKETIRMWTSVRRGEEQNIFPYQEQADVMINSASVYELCVLKQYAEPLLFGIPRDSEEYIEAKRLLKFLDYILGISSEDVPRNSIVREFIGGSCFNV